MTETADGVTVMEEASEEPQLQQQPRKTRKNTISEEVF